jgi:hypothetical protein
MEQQSLLDLLDSDRSDISLRPEASKTINDINRNEDLSDTDITTIRESLLIESVKSAFGASRGGRKRKPSDEAWEWILSDDREQPFSFARCCRSFGVDHEEMIELLRYYRRKLKI